MPHNNHHRQKEFYKWTSKYYVWLFLPSLQVWSWHPVPAAKKNMRHSRITNRSSNIPGSLTSSQWKTGMTIPSPPQNPPGHPLLLFYRKKFLDSLLSTIISVRWNWTQPTVLCNSVSWEQPEWLVLTWITNKNIIWYINI